MAQPGFVFNLEQLSPRTGGGADGYSGPAQRSSSLADSQD